MQITLLAALALAELVHGHGFIKSFTVGGQTTTAQKTNIKQSAFRAVSDNTGWIGSNFLGSDCAVCGCSNTPFNTVASPSGTVFSTAGQAAGQSPSVAAGSAVTLHVAGNPGEGWPHPNGHLQVYLADCGGSCANFDAKTGNYFKIQSIPNGIPPLRAAYDRSSDSNPWNVPIPSAVKAGNYLMRAEIWAYGQSSAAEGNQAQFYPFCAHISVTGGGNANPATVSFPDTYANDKNIASQGISYVPGPQINTAFGGSGTGTGSGTAVASTSNSSSSSNSGASTGNTAAGASTGSSKGTTGAGSTTNSSGSTTNSSGTTTKKGSSKKCGTSSKKRRSHRRHHERNAVRAAAGAHAHSA